MFSLGPRYSQLCIIELPFEIAGDSIRGGSSAFFLCDAEVAGPWTQAF